MSSLQRVLYRHMQAKGVLLTDGSEKDKKVECSLRYKLTACCQEESEAHFKLEFNINLAFNIFTGTTLAFGKCLLGLNALVIKRKSEAVTKVLSTRCPSGQRRNQDADEHHHAAEEDLQPPLHVPANRGMIPNPQDHFCLLFHIQKSHLFPFKTKRQSNYYITKPDVIFFCWPAGILL